MQRFGVRRRGVALASLLATCTAIALCLAPPLPAQAVTATDFDAGNIISDDLFYDGNSMSAADVQSFLNLQVARCTIGDPGKAPGTAWGGSSIANNCLKTFSTATVSRPTNAFCSAYVGAPAESAAQIIAKVGKACGISPKVLLVMLEKEQSLVSDSWPTNRQLDIAMGYACPDSGPNNSPNCDAEYFGFMNQVYRSAWQLKVYRANPNSYRYKPFQANTVQWHPNAGCGTSQVYIENWATAALYIYTPYRPNQSALNAGWGTGDSCSTYGNRNFFLFYKSWFGDTKLPKGTPVGEVKDLWTASNEILLWGWAMDLDAQTTPLQIHVRFGTSWAAGVADTPNASAESLYPGSGPNHGFGMRFAAPAGPQNVCVYAKNLGQGVDRLLTCRDVVVPSGDPAGELKDIWGTPGKINMWGWALDPDTVAPIDLHISVNGRWAVLKADAENLSTTGAYPTHGINHGFGGSIPADPGMNKICVYGINQGPGSNTTLACKNIFVESGSPVGQVKELWGTPGSINMWGWAIDPDTVDPIDLHVSINDRWAVVKANTEYPSVGSAYPAHGINHGFGATIPADPGSNRVCVYAINQGAGSNTTLACQTVFVRGGSPVGEVKDIWGTPGAVSMWGWAADPDTVDPIDLHVRVDGTQWFVVRADTPYTTMPGLLAGVGINHGFGSTLPLGPGTHEVCVFAVNVGPGTSQTLRCANITT